MVKAAQAGRVNRVPVRAGEERGTLQKSIALLTPACVTQLNSLQLGLVLNLRAIQELETKALQDNKSEGGSRLEFLPAASSPGEGHGNPLQYPCLENSMDRGAWRATVHEVMKTQT